MQPGAAIKMTKLIKNFVIYLVSFFVGLAIGGAIIISYEANTVKPWSWASPPIIVNCYGKELNNLYIIPGVEFWTLRGEDIGFIEDNPLDSVCDNDLLDGFILLKKETIKDSKTLAYTRRRTSFGEIRAATIYFNPGVYRMDMIIEHELGHALGYSHVKEVGHIMYPDYDGMGLKFWIP